MEKCPYYAIFRQSLESKEIWRDMQQRVQIVSIPYCEHADSPAPLDHVRRVIGGGRILQCGGDTTKCQLPGGFTP
jgi:hypothetical protein